MSYRERVEERVEDKMMMVVECWPLQRAPSHTLTHTQVNPVGRNEHRQRLMQRMTEGYSPFPTALTRTQTQTQIDREWKSKTRERTSLTGKNKNAAFSCPLKDGDLLENRFDWSVPVEERMTHGFEHGSFGSSWRAWQAATFRKKSQKFPAAKVD